MPVVGATNSYWDVTAYADGTIVKETWSTATTTALDPVTGVYSRNDGRPDTWTQNSPLPGLLIVRPRLASASRWR